MRVRRFLKTAALWALALVSVVAPGSGAVSYVASRTNDSLTAVEGRTVKWQFFTGGPVRYAPATWGQNVYVGSDDGCIYCLNAAAGTEVWRFSAGPANRKMIGNERMVSVWHISAGPVVKDGRIYFAAGTWPMLGVFVYCLDAATGRIVWLNDHTDAEWQPMSFRRQNWRGSNRNGEDDAGGSEGITGKLYGNMPYSVAPKGQCTIKDNRLVVPCGRAVPAFFDLETGELLRKYTYAPEDRDLLAGSVDRKTKDGQERLASRNETANWECPVDRTPAATLAADPLANQVLASTHVADGYALVLGIGDGRLIDGLLASSALRLVVVDPDAGKVDALRRRLDAAGYYGLRVTALADDPSDAGMPPYFASLIVAADPPQAGVLDPAFVKRIFASLRPYGGVACLGTLAAGEAIVRSLAGSPGMEKAEVSRTGEWVLLRRVGALPGAGAWSHQYGNAGNTCSTGEALAGAPLGALWYGGAAGDAETITYAIERGGRGVIPLIVGGCLFFEQSATRKLTATDVYTGRLLWQWTPPDQEKWVIWPEKAKGKYWASYGCVTLTGRAAATEDAVYAVSGVNVYALDAATGKPLPGFRCEEKDQWESPRVWRDSVFLASGTRVLALDRHTGRVLWSFKEFGGVLAAGGDKVFCLQTRETAQKTGAARLVALNASNGTRLWDMEMRVGAKTNSQALAYSEEHDRLITSMGAYVGRTGKMVEGGSMLNLNTSAYGAWTLVLKDSVFTINTPKGLGGLVDLTTGARLRYTDPITGTDAIDTVDRGKSHLVGGCGPALAGETLATFRMDTAAYYDLRDHSGVRNIGGIRPACTAGMIPADGLVCLPNNNICICRYPVFTTLALAHMPDIDTWSYFPGCSPNPVTQPIKQVGINFGAPGDRLADNRTLWLEHPVVGGPSPKVELTTEPANPQWFRYHSSRVRGGNGVPWVCASGAKDLRSVTIRVNGGGPYRVREYNAEPIAENDLALRSSVIEHRNVKAGPDGRLKWAFAGKGYVCGLELIAETP